MPDRIPSHRPQQLARPSATKRGYGQSWRRIRARVLAEQPICATLGCGQPATDVDHEDGNVEHLARENLKGYCHACHSRKTVQHDGGFGRMKERKK